MKRTLTRLLALVCACIFTFTFTACDKGNDKNVDSSATEKQIWLPYTMLDHSENCKRTYYYDEYGNEIKMTKEDQSGNIQATWFYEYDENHNLTKRSVDTGNGEPFVQLIQTYDDNGNLIEKREISLSSEHIYTYQYDEQNRIASVSNGGEIIETYVYQADGSYKVQRTNYPDQYTLYSADGKIQELRTGTNTKVIYSYNKDGVLVECTTYSGENITSKTVYHLDNNGNAVKISHITESGGETVLSEIEYKQYTVKLKGK